jgi:ABC-type sugar transport system substrate-binding protein
MQIVCVPSAPGITLNTSQANLVANWYDASELQPYPPTSMGNLIQAPGQGGGNVQQGTIYIDTVAAGGTLIMSTQTQNIFIYGFDITGDKSAAVNTGKMSISGLYDPKTMTPLGTNPSWWINQGPSGTAFMDPRFPTALQGSGPSLAVPLPFISQQ